MSNPIVFILSCNKDRLNGSQQASADTWLKTWGHLVAHKTLIYDNCPNPGPDELMLGPDPGYNEVSLCMQRALQWSLDNGYDYSFVACVDTYVVVPRLLASGYEKGDYVGLLCGNTHYLSGAPGRWFSPRARDAILAAKSHPTYEDNWTGDVLALAKITPTNDPRYWAGDQHATPFPYNDRQAWGAEGGIISVHLGRGTGTFIASWMHACHKAYLEATQ